jgi:hypothetical protein
MNSSPARAFWRFRSLDRSLLFIMKVPDTQLLRERFLSQFVVNFNIRRMLAM